MKKNVFILIISLFFSTYTNGQDMQFTQFYSSPLYLNPAFAGAGSCSRVSLAYRNQWPGVKKGYVSQLASIDHFFHKEKFGGGLLVTNDVSGSGSLQRSTVNLLLAYETRLNRKLVLRYGFQPGVGFVSIDYSKLIFGDQIARGGNVTSLEQQPSGKVYFDMGAGVLLYAKEYWGGIAIHHFVKHEEGLINPYVELPLKYSVHGGYKFLLKEDLKDDSKSEHVSIALNYRGQQNFDQLDIGAYYSKSRMNVGIWYRGIPGLKSYKPGYGNNDAIAILVGIKTDRFNFGYSYDITISKLTIASAGAHEITIGGHLCNPNKKRKRQWPVPCPKF